jgi:hypothetical protein
MNDKGFYVSEYVEDTEIRRSLGTFPSPLAFYLERFCNAVTPNDARSAVDDFFKISLQIITLILISVLKRRNRNLPAKTEKYFKSRTFGGRDLTEGMRLEVIADVIDDSTRWTEISEMERSLLRALSGIESYSFEKLLDYKIETSHHGSGDDQNLVDGLRNIIPSFLGLWGAWESMSNLTLSSVVHAAGRQHIGISASARCSPVSNVDGLYLIDKNSKDLICLSPFIIIDEELNILVFIHANGRKEQDSSTYKCIGAKTSKVLMGSEVLRAFETLMSHEVPVPLFGMDKNLKKLKANFKDWESDKTDTPLIFVTGEEGTGKSSLVSRASAGLDLKIIKMSGASGPGELSAFCFEFLAQLLDQDQDNDLMTIRRLHNFGTETGAIRSTEILGKFLTGRSDFEEKYSDQTGIYDRTTSKGLGGENSNSLEIFEDVNENRVNRIFQALLVIVKAWTSSKNRKVILWIQDAQLYETQPQVSLHVLLSLQKKQKNTGFLILAEFRSERSLDARRIAEQFEILSAINFKTEQLSKNDILNLVAWKLKPPEGNLHVQVGIEISKSSGGNPKWILDALQALIDSEEIRIGQSATEISLLLPRLIRKVVPGELKSIAKRRLSSRRLSSMDLNVLIVLTLCQSQSIPAQFLSKILGEQCADSIIKLEEGGFIKDDNTVDEWTLSFDHLATLQACREFISLLESSELEELTDKCLLALNNTDRTSEKDDIRQLSALVKQLAEITKRPEALAQTIPSAIPNATLEQLNAWSQILKKVFNPSSFLALVRLSISLKISCLTNSQPSAESLGNTISILRHCDIPIGSSRAQDYILLKSLCFSMVAERQILGSKELVAEVIQFMHSLDNLCHTHVIPSQHQISFANVLWHELGTSCKYSKFSELLAEFSIALDQNKFSDSLRELLIAKARISEILNFRENKSLVNNEDELNKVLKLISRVLSNVEASPSLGVSNEVTAEFFELVRFDLSIIIQLADDRELLRQSENILSVLDRLESYCNPQKIDEVRRVLSWSVASHLTTIEDAEVGNDLTSFIASLKSSKWSRIVAFSAMIIDKHTHGVSNPSLVSSFLSEIGDGVDATIANRRDMRLLLKACNAVGLHQSKDLCVKLVDEWIAIRVTQDKGLSDVLTLIEDDLAFADIDTKVAIEKLLVLRSWKSDEKKLIELANLDISAIDGEQSWIKMFDSIHDFYATSSAEQSGSLRNAIMGKSISKLLQLIFVRLNEHSKDIPSRYKSFIDILNIAFSTKSRGIDRLKSYWRSRWYAMIQIGRQVGAVSECNELIGRFSPNHREKLVPELLRLIGPSVDRDRIRDSDDSSVEDYTLTDQVVSLLREWSTLDPSSSDCAHMLVRAASFIRGSESNELLSLARQIGDRLVSEYEFDSASYIFEDLIFGFYREHDSKNAIESIKLEKFCKQRTLPRGSGVDEINLRNKGNYVQLGLALHSGVISSALLEDMRQCHDLVVDDVMNRGTCSYNYAIALAYTGEFDSSYAILRNLLSLEKHLSKARKTEFRWGFLFIGGDRLNSRTTFEFEFLDLTISILLSMTHLLISKSRLDEASMWLWAAQGRYKSQLRKLKHCPSRNVLAMAFLELKYSLPDWLTEGSSLFNLSALSDGNNQPKNALSATNKLDNCPCGSGNIFRECCADLLRLETS